MGEPGWESFLHAVVKRAPGKAPGIIKIESTDGAIDNLVYELYGLIEEDIRIVEGS